jgi:hypothetical protein
MTNQHEPIVQGEIYGGLVLSIAPNEPFLPLTFPFEGDRVSRGNQIRPHDPVRVSAFDFWHSSNGAHVSNVYVPERALKIEARTVGKSPEETTRDIVHRFVTVNAGVPTESRQNILDTLSSVVLPHLVGPSLISMEVQSPQPKFVFFSRDVPLHFTAYCDDAAMILVWSNEDSLESRMRERYGERFLVFRMKPVLNSVLVVNTYFLQKSFSRWKTRAFQGPKSRDRLKLLNAIEAKLSRRVKSDEKEF